MRKTATQSRVFNGPKQLSHLYETDEAAWLERSIELLRHGHYEELDSANMIDCLEALLMSQKREVKRRLVSLMAHLLKWQFQPTRRSNSWRRTIFNQRFELSTIFDSKTLKNHALEILPWAYPRAVKKAMVETGQDRSSFPADCPYTFAFLVSDELPESGGRE